MSWQEELRKLDEELASGRLSADDYRVRRDQVLSSAVGQPDAPTAQPDPASQINGVNPDATQVIPSLSPPRGVPQQQPPAADPSADRTQAVPLWQAQQSPEDPNRTQYVQPQYPASPPGGFPQAGTASPAGGFQQPWNAPDTDQAPPWGGGDLPPLVPSDSGGWVQQGPESFEDKAGKGNSTKIVAIVVAVVVLAGIALGAYLLWGRGSVGGQSSAQPATSRQASSPAAPGPLGVANIPGTPESHDDVTTFNAVSGLNYLNPDELSTYSSAGAAGAKYVVNHLDDGDVVVLLLTEVNSPVAAQNAASQLLSIQVRNGATRLGNTPSGVFASAFDTKDGNPAQVRGHYAHGDVIVRIEVHGPSLQAARSDFTTILAAQLQVLPANA